MGRKNHSGPGGRALYGLITGLILGVAAAGAVMIYVTKVPMPFADKASRAPAETLLPDVRDAPDPNISLYGKDNAAGVTPTGPVDTTVAPGQIGQTAQTGQAGQASQTTNPQAAKKVQPPAGDSIRDLIANLSKSADAPASSHAGTRPAAGAKTSAGTSVAINQPRAVPGTGVTPHVKPPPAASATATAPAPVAAPGTRTTYYLQAGAFRSEDDAEATKARIILMGLPVQVQKAQINGATMNRVRVGPFKGIDEMNKSRARLGEEKIASSVVRQ